MGGSRSRPVAAAPKSNSGDGMTGAWDMALQSSPGKVRDRLEQHRMTATALLQSEHRGNYISMLSSSSYGGGTSSDAGRQYDEELNYDCVRSLDSSQHMPRDVHAHAQYG